MAASYAAISAVLKLCFSLEPSLTNPLANLPLPRAMHFASLGNVAPMAAVPSSSSDEAFVEQYFPMTHKKQRAIYFLFHFFSRIALTAAPPRAVFVAQPSLLSPLSQPSQLSQRTLSALSARSLSALSLSTLLASVF